MRIKFVSLFWCVNRARKKVGAGTYTLRGGWREDVPLRRRFWPVCQVGSRPVLMHSSLARPHLAIFTPGSNNRLGILCFSSFIIIAAIPLASLHSSSRYLFICICLWISFSLVDVVHTRILQLNTAERQRSTTSYTLVCCLPGARDLWRANSPVTREPHYWEPLITISSPAPAICQQPSLPLRPTKSLTRRGYAAARMRCSAADALLVAYLVGFLSIKTRVCKKHAFHFDDLYIMLNLVN
jgi:hypothetical protein